MEGGKEGGRGRECDKAKGKEVKGTTFSTPYPLASAFSGQLGWLSLSKLRRDRTSDGQVRFRLLSYTLCHGLVVTTIISSSRSNIKIELCDVYRPSSI